MACEVRGQIKRNSVRRPVFLRILAVYYCEPPLVGTAALPTTLPSHTAMPWNFSRISQPSFITAAVATVAAALCLHAAHAANADKNDTTAPRVLSNGAQISSLRDARGQRYVLRYAPARRRIELQSPSGTRTVEHIVAGADPGLVGADRLIRFLPLALQPYLAAGDLLFTTAVRSRNNDGGGQCGAGAEVELHVLRTVPTPARIIASVPLASCLGNIEPLSDGSDPPWSALSVEHGRLAATFLSYRNQEGDLHAWLSNDKARWVFPSRPMH